MKPKEWLHANGHLKEIGRGRLSKEHIALVTKAAETTFIEGYSRGDVVPVTKAKVSVNKPVSDDETGIVELAPILYPFDQYRVFGYTDGKKVYASTKEACQEHGYSVCGHDCIGGTVNGPRGTFTITDYERIT